MGTGPDYRDELAITPRRAFGNIEKIQFVIHIPEQFEKAMISNKVGEEWGRKVDGPDITGNQPSGFRSLGWEAYNVNGLKSHAVEGQT